MTSDFDPQRGSVFLAMKFVAWSSDLSLEKGDGRLTSAHLE